MAKSKSKSTSKLADSGVLMSLMMMLLGLIMLAYGNHSIEFIFWLSGVVMIVFGILGIILGAIDAKGGLIIIVIGIILLVIGMVPELARILVGVILIVSALPLLLGASKGLSDKFGMDLDTGSTQLNKIIAVILLVVGVCLIAGLAIGGLEGVADILIRIGGLVLLALGIVALIKELN